MANDSNNPKPKPKRKHIKVKNDLTETFSWFDVHAADIQWLVGVSHDMGLLTSFSGRRDLTALSIRPWHNTVKIEPLYFIPDSDGRLPDKVVDYLAEIGEALDKAVAARPPRDLQ